VSADSLTEEQLNWHKEELNRQRLMDAAAACIAERGIAKTRMGNIAEQSGMARQTIYNYYSSREELLGATLLREGMGVAEQVAREIRDYESLEDKFVAAFMCGLREFPANPLLSRLLQDATYRGKVGLTPELFQVAGEASMREIFDAHPEFQEEAGDMIELWVRSLLSFLTSPNIPPKTPDEMERYVRRRLVPGLLLGLPN